MNKIDLHMHSMYSNDGNFSPEELVKKCKEAGIEIMAVADHNSCKACEAAVKAAKKAGITCIPGIEIDCRYKGTDLHVLGYGIDYRDKRYLDLEENIAAQERNSSKIRLEKIQELGLQIDEQKIYALAHNGSVTGEVIAEVALADPENAGNPILEPYRKDGSRSDNPFVNFYWDWCGPGKPAYIEMDFMSLQEAIALIKSSGGTPVLAHPGNNVKENDQLLDAILNCGIEGIEVYSSYHSPEQVEYYKKKVEEYKLIVTCGSDFHGKTKPSVYLGQIEYGDMEQVILTGAFIL